MTAATDMYSTKPNSPSLTRTPIHKHQSHPQTHHRQNPRTRKLNRRIPQPAKIINQHPHPQLPDNHRHRRHSRPHHRHSPDHHHHVHHAKQRPGQLPLRHIQKTHRMGRLKKQNQQPGRHRTHNKRQQTTAQHPDALAQTPIDRRLHTQHRTGQHHHRQQNNQTHHSPPRNQNQSHHNQPQRQPPLGIDLLARRAEPTEMVNQHTLANLPGQNRNHGHRNADMRRRQGQHHHIHRPQKPANQLPARQISQCRAFLRASEQQQQKQNRRAHTKDAQGRPQMPDLHAQRPEQPRLHRQAHARENHQRQQQQAQPRLRRRRANAHLIQRLHKQPSTQVNDGADYRLAQLCDKWEHPDNTFAQYAQQDHPCTGSTNSDSRHSGCLWPFSITAVFPKSPAAKAWRPLQSPGRFN
ncbi:hypothetical protein EMIT0P395_180126 [Pseudomonas sp. IT-P395]